MYQNPVGEIEKYYGTKIIYEGLEISGESVLCDIRGRVMDITVILEVGDDSAFDRFEIKLAKGERHFTSLSYDARRSVFKIDRSRSGVVNDIVNSREFEVLTVNGSARVDIEKNELLLLNLYCFLPAFLSQTSAVVPMTSDVKGVPSFFSKCSCALFTYLKPMYRSVMLQ